MPLYHATSIGKAGYKFDAPGIAPPASGCALVASSGEGARYVMGWTARPVLQEPAVAPTDDTQYLSPGGWADIPQVTSGAVASALGYVPANRAGETFTGNVNIGTHAWTGTIQLGGANSNYPNINFNALGLQSMILLNAPGNTTDYRSNGPHRFYDSGGNNLQSIQAGGTSSFSSLDVSGQIRITGSPNHTRLAHGGAGVLKVMQNDAATLGGLQVNSVTLANSLGLSYTMSIHTAAGTVFENMGPNSPKYTYGSNDWGVSVSPWGHTVNLAENTTAIGTGSKKGYWFDIGGNGGYGDAGIFRGGVNTVAVGNRNGTLGTLQANSIAVNSLGSAGQGGVFFGWTPGSRGFSFADSGFSLKAIADGAYLWSSTNNVNSSTDTQLRRPAAGTVGIYQADGITLGTIQAGTITAQSDAINHWSMTGNQLVGTDWGVQTISIARSFGGQILATSASRISFSDGNSLSNVFDAAYGRNGVGRLGAYANNGLAVRNYANTANAPVQCSEIDFGDNAGFARKITPQSYGVLIPANSNIAGSLYTGNNLLSTHTYIEMSWFDGGGSSVARIGYDSANTRLRARANGGLAVRNADNNADAPITASEFRLPIYAPSGLSARLVQSSYGVQLIDGWGGSSFYADQYNTQFPSSVVVGGTLQTNAIATTSNAVNFTHTPTNTQWQFDFNTPGASGRLNLNGAGVRRLTLSGRSDQQHLLFETLSSNAYVGLGTDGMGESVQNGFQFLPAASGGGVRLIASTGLNPMLRLGGTTSSFSAIKGNGTAINFRLANDSADAAITASSYGFSGNTASMGFGSSDRIFMNWGGSPIYILTSSQFQLRGDRVIGWADPGFTINPDVALGRNAAGVLEINNGTAGQFRDLQARTYRQNDQFGVLHEMRTTLRSTMLSIAGVDILGVIGAGSGMVAVGTCPLVKMAASSGSLNGEINAMDCGGSWTFTTDYPGNFIAGTGRRRINSVSQTTTDHFTLSAASGSVANNEAMAGVHLLLRAGRAAIAGTATAANGGDVIIESGSAAGAGLHGTIRFRRESGNDFLTLGVDGATFSGNINVGNTNLILSQHTNNALQIKSHGGLRLRNLTDTGFSSLEVGQLVGRGYSFILGSGNAGEISISSGAFTSNCIVSDQGAGLTTFGVAGRSIQQSFGASTTAWSARSRMLATGQRAFEVGDGASTWQTGYREEYNAGGLRCGFYGATPIARQTFTTGDGADALAALLHNLGLITKV